MKITLTAQELLAMVQAQMQPLGYDIGFDAVTVGARPLREVEIEIDLSKAGRLLTPVPGRPAPTMDVAPHRKPGCDGKGRSRARGCIRCNPDAFGLESKTPQPCGCSDPMPIPAASHPAGSDCRTVTSLVKDEYCQQCYARARGERVHVLRGDDKTD